MDLIIPGKTFLVGEYSALVGGSVIGLATGPGFKITYQTETQGVQDFSMQSPAGLLLRESSSASKNVKIKIQDGFAPYGGFGKSTAEYLSAAHLANLLQTSEDFECIRKTYQNYSQKSGAKVSGLDLAIQYFGAVTHFDSASNNYTSHPWGFPSHDFILVSTGQKVKTHEHILQLNKNVLATLKPVAELVIASYFKKNINDFIIGLKVWCEVLEHAGFLTEKSKDLKTQLENQSEILCVKPCGAMGADVLLVFCKQENSEHVQKQIQGMNLKIQGTSTSLMQGVQSCFKNYSKPIISRPYVD